MRRAGPEWQGHSESRLGPKSNQPALGRGGRGGAVAAPPLPAMDRPGPSRGGKPPCGAHPGSCGRNGGRLRRAGRRRHNKQGRRGMEGAGLNLKSGRPEGEWGTDSDGGGSGEREWSK